MNISLKRLNSFQQKATSQMFEKVLNMPLTQKLTILYFYNFKPSLKKVKTFVYFEYIGQNNPNNRK